MRDHKRLRRFKRHEEECFTVRTTTSQGSSLTCRLRATEFQGEYQFRRSTRDFYQRDAVSPDGRTKNIFVFFSFAKMRKVTPRRHAAQRPANLRREKGRRKSTRARDCLDERPRRSEARNIRVSPHTRAPSLFILLRTSDEHRGENLLCILPDW